MPQKFIFLNDHSNHKFFPCFTENLNRNHRWKLFDQLPKKTLILSTKKNGKNFWTLNININKFRYCQPFRCLVACRISPKWNATAKQQLLLFVLIVQRSYTLRSWIAMVHSSSNKGTNGICRRHNSSIQPNNRMGKI